jgi:ABC-2 type transport system permease protein
MFAVAGLDWRSLPLALVAVLASGAVFTAAAVTVQSLAFWLGEMEQLARQVWEFTLAFSLYPKPLFSGSISFLLYTLIPAGFVGFLPVELVRAPSLALLAGVLAAALGWWLIALLVFHAGLRRYESGNRFGARG